MKFPYLPLVIVVAALTVITACKPKPVATVQASTPEPAAPAAADNQSAPPQQNGNGGGQANFQQRAQQRLDEMKTTVGLTDDQAQQVSTMMKDQMGAMRAQTQTMSRDDRRAAFQKARAEINAKIEAMLTPDQKPKWDEYQKQMEARRGQRRQGGAGGGAPAVPVPAGTTN